MINWTTPNNKQPYMDLLKAQKILSNNYIFAKVYAGYFVYTHESITENAIFCKFNGYLNWIENNV